MRDKHGYTPKESVLSFVCDTLRQHTRLPPNSDHTPAFSREWNRQAARLHNRLLDESGLDGLMLDESVAPAKQRRTP